jgi:glycerol kinase
MPGVPAAGHFAPAMDETTAKKHRQRWKSAVTQTLATQDQQNSGGNQ